MPKACGHTQTRVSWNKYPKYDNWRPMVVICSVGTPGAKAARMAAWACSIGFPRRMTVTRTREIRLSFAGESSKLCRRARTLPAQRKVVLQRVPSRCLDLVASGEEQPCEETCKVLDGAVCLERSVKGRSIEAEWVCGPCLSLVWCPAPLTTAKLWDAEQPAVRRGLRWPLFAR